MRRSRNLSLSLVLSLAAACSSTGLRSAPAPEYDAPTFYETTSLFGAAFTPDESRVIFTSDESGVYNVYSMPVDGDASADVQALTRSTTNATYSVDCFPADERVLFTADEGGNELNHLFVRELNGETRDLTPGDNVKASFVGWARDGGAFFATTNERDPQYFDLYRYVVGDPGTELARTMVFQNPGGFDVSAISGDGRWVALNKTRNNADSDVHLVDLRSGGDVKHVTPHEGDATHVVQTFTPDSTRLIYSSNLDSEFDRAWAYDLASGERELLVSADWDVSYVRFSREGRYRVVGVNADARTEVEILDRLTGKPVRTPGLPAGDIRGVRFSRSEQRMAFYVNGDTAPSNLFVMDLDKGRPRRLTQSLNPAIDGADLVESEVIRYRSFDGLEIPALLYRPHGSSRSHRAPALVWVHGGPGGQSRAGYDPMTQHLVNHGYAVLKVNNRGSSGYGKTFFHADDRKHGDVDLEDCVQARRYLESLDWVDGERVGIIGGSYGGYMVVAALAFRPEVFDVGIDIFGVTNWLRTLESIPPWWADFRDALYAEMGDPEEDAERLRARSPLFHADQIRRPLLVVQGANDPRVLQAESDEIVAAVRANGVPVEYVLFPDEGHGFRNRDNRIRASEAFLGFLETHLGAVAAQP